ncbi:MAG: glucosamine-6-phosphate deaminase [Acidobacteriota bacterium]
MEIIIQPDWELASRLAAQVLAHQIRRKPDSVLGLATGSSPLGVYRELIRMHREEGLDFSQVRTFNLDEYIGLPPEHPSSYHCFMHEHLLDQVNLKPSNIHIPNGMTKDISLLCRHYEESIERAGGLDIQLLGLGTNAHIGFNEPSSSLASRTRIKTLSERTLRDNARFFSDSEEAPRHVITMGIGTILDSRRCLLLAFGSKKAGAVAKMVEGAVTAMVPASALQLHPRVQVILDSPAASLLEHRRYYQWVFDHKPDWQRLE